MGFQNQCGGRGGIVEVEPAGNAQKSDGTVSGETGNAVVNGKRDRGTVRVTVRSSELFVSEKALPDETSAAFRVTADMRAVN